MANNPSSSTTLQCPKLRKLAIHLVDPDLRPYKGIVLEVTPHSGGSTCFINNKGEYKSPKSSPTWSSTTDDQGIAWFTLPAGAYQLTHAKNEDELVKQAKMMRMPSVDPYEKSTQAKTEAQLKDWVHSRFRLEEFLTKKIKLPKYQQVVINPSKTSPLSIDFIVSKAENHCIAELYPLRAYVPVLSHTKEYNDLNAYNLSLFSIISYALLPSKKAMDDHGYEILPGTIKYTIDNDWAELKKPLKVDNASCKNIPWVLIDVPYDKRFLIDDSCAAFANVMFHKETDGEEHLCELQAFFVYSKDSVVLFTRGTDNLANVLTDGTADQIPFKDGVGYVHKGFYEAFNILKKKLHEKLKDNLTGKKLFIAAHSLGGAMATLFAVTYRDYNPVLYTIGSPRVGTDTFVNTYKAITHYRIVNYKDPVTSVPSRWMDIRLRTVLPSLVFISHPIGITTFLYSTVDLDGAIGLDKDRYFHHGHLKYILPIDDPLSPNSNFQIMVTNIKHKGLIDSKLVQELFKKDDDMPDFNFIGKLLRGNDHRAVSGYAPHLKELLIYNYLNIGNDPKVEYRLRSYEIKINLLKRQGRYDEADELNQTYNDLKLHYNKMYTKQSVLGKHQSNLKYVEKTLRNTLIPEPKLGDIF
ncbi:lipase family protein [Zooshikella harenae]|uniref:Lipase family protein n=1 Tax=Zooshikella harenae TaxID=2827238 RepID=A0ABS5ZIC4_9GAMM|nr:lipase family protein [Zooshikella harenae]MBU2713792.1 lipase family protein [Zooshikella harenae]